MRIKFSLLVVVVVLLLVAAVPSFALSQPAVDISLFNGACTYVGGVSVAPITLSLMAKVAGAEVSIPEFGLVAHPVVGQLEFLVTPPVPNGGSFTVLVNGQQAFDPIMQLVNCAPVAAAPVVHSGPGDSFICAVPMPEGVGSPLYAQLVRDEDLVSWNGYLAVVEGQLQLFAHPHANVAGPWRVTTDEGWEATFDVVLVGPKVCEVVVH